MPEYPDPQQMEMITVSTAVKTLTSTKYAPSGGGQVFHALISINGADVRYTMNGTDPVAGSIGHLLSDGDAMVIYGKESIMNFKCIRNASTDALLAATYFF